jgi:hypothetical protein
MVDNFSLADDGTVGTAATDLWFDSFEGPHPEHDMAHWKKRHTLARLKKCQEIFR